MYFSTTDSQVIAATLTNELALVNKWLIDNNLLCIRAKRSVCYLGLDPGLALSTSFL